MAAKILLLAMLIGVTYGFNPYIALSGAKMIFPKKVISDIPSKLLDKVKKFDEDDDSLTSSYTFPPNYKSTIYKDYAQKTTLVNVFPSVETKTYSLQFQDLGYQQLETSTTLIYEALNSTVEYQTTPMLNSTLVYPTTAPIQSIGYSTPEYQHEVLVYPTQINITHMTSTTLANFTRVEEIENNVPFL